MRVATWNINSIRARWERAAAWLGSADVDVLALQETKVKDEAFPREPFEALGYEVVTHGYSQWNGVAILSRVGVADVEVGFPGQPAWGDPAVVEARALGATCGGVRVWSLYVPNGREVDDPHYAYKLEWLAALRDAAGKWLADDPELQATLMGDWNIAPLDTDVWDIERFAGRTHVTPAERAAFRAFAEGGWTEVSRTHVPAEHTYTYWDYQQLRFPRNEGMRIDHALATPALAARVTGVTFVRDQRKGKQPSDHVPVVLEIAD
ncbi:exodeoxyribonuclease III [Cellulomonas shaoxiangyii]|uniref:Exodeoxyribonuclease III n=1 Tax=Cellulomonas shaoxiangyii TaxID=2566013 RepID=A0A4P7SN39_9CELL|nr:exodeoxyribonuclease III [Cellulomonas shaoxiangyii]QCB94676.1 exodeoxyribonuclease III [Cellulomonas shaoxiangyii]TGY84729.1 exodeoxyribonuclease III [Cellulomonas shaoxiangyii]